MFPISFTRADYAQAETLNGGTSAEALVEVDRWIGEILARVEKLGIADNTIVVLWSDHGYHLGEKQTFKKFTLWEEATKVPFIIYDGRPKENIFFVSTVVSPEAII